MRFMTIERFRSRDPAPNLDCCFQLMECGNEHLFQDWIESPSGLMDFKIAPVAAPDQIQMMFFPRV